MDIHPLAWPVLGILSPNVFPLVHRPHINEYVRGLEYQEGRISSRTTATWQDGVFVGPSMVNGYHLVQLEVHRTRRLIAESATVSPEVEKLKPRPMHAADRSR